MAFWRSSRLSSALWVLIEGQNHLVDVEDCFPATVSLLRTVEGGKGFGWGKRIVQTWKVRPTIKLLLVEVVGCFYWLMLFKPLATGVNALVFQWWRPAFLHIFQNSLCTGYVRFKGFGAGVFWHQWEGNYPFIFLFLLVSSSTSCNSRLHNGKGSCADRPRNQTGSRRSALLPWGSCDWKWW